MNVHSMCFSRVLRYAAVTSLLFMAVSFTSVANAAQGMRGRLSQGHS